MDKCYCGEPLTEGKATCDNPFHSRHGKVVTANLPITAEDKCPDCNGKQILLHDEGDWTSWSFCKCNEPITAEDEGLRMGIKGKRRG